MKTAVGSQRELQGMARSRVSKGHKSTDYDLWYWEFIMVIGTATVWVMGLMWFWGSSNLGY